MPPFDLVASRLVREPFNQPWESLRKLDPVSARLLFFRDPEWDELFEGSNDPPQLRAYEDFVGRLAREGYAPAHAERLWAARQARLQAGRPS